jgi:hypothetical protein
MPRLTAGRVELYYESLGEGTPMVLQAHDHTPWLFGQAPVFSQRYRFLAYDRRGTGRSSSPRGDWTAADPRWAASSPRSSRWTIPNEPLLWSSGTPSPISTTPDAHGSSSRSRTLAPAVRSSRASPLTARMARGRRRPIPRSRRRRWDA